MFPAQEQALQCRHYDQQHHRPDQHTAYDHRGERTLYLAADPGRNGGREQADAG
jgi:hypothetical protein